VSKFAITALGILTILGLVIAGAPLAQASTNAQAACVETYTVVAGDLLSRIAERYLGDLKAYPQIVTATNEAAKTDTSFKTIADPNIIEVGQKLCIPARAAGTTPAANTTPSANTTPTITSSQTVSPTVTTGTTVTTTATVTATAATTTTVSATPTPPPGSLEGTYIASLPAADASALLWQVFLGPNGNAAWLSNYVGKGTINATGVWEQTSATTVTVTLIQEEDRNIHEVFMFEVQGDKLVATQYNQSRYGDSGITLFKADKQVTGTVTYLEKIALPNDAVLEVYLLDATTPNAPATYISGYSASTHGDQVPLTFNLPYDSLQTLANGRYVVEAYISANGKLLFRNNSGLAVITNGAPTTNVEIVTSQVTQ
jgi:uncharacterized lipoprotein YbaY/LysM repeat protein